MSEDTKPTNPKDAIGSDKLPLELVPDSASAFMALAFLEGASKYGRYNWRVAGVRSSIYVAAARRHLAKFWNGEWADKKTEVPHLASVMACCAIILDAHLSNKLTDDRPPKQDDFSDLVDVLSHDVKALKKLLEGHSPKQWTINDPLERKP